MVLILAGSLELDETLFELRRDGLAVSLEPQAFDVLVHLVRNRDALMREVWGWADASGTRTLDSHVKALRAKIGADRVRTVHGVGYALEVAP